MDINFQHTGKFLGGTLIQKSLIPPLIYLLGGTSPVNLKAVVILVSVAKAWAFSETSSVSRFIFPVKLEPSNARKLYEIMKIQPQGMPATPSSKKAATFTGN